MKPSLLCTGPLLLAWLALLTACSARLNVSEKMMWSTYPLATQRGAATGFVINRRDPSAAGGVVPVVLTSEHVLATMGRGPLLIGVRMPDEKGAAQVVLVAYTPPKPQAGERFYVRHSRHDLAAFTLRLPPEAAGQADLRSYLDERLVVHDGNFLHSGEEVCFLGYPEVLPGTEGAFPVLRSGRVASYPVGTAQAHGCFLINSDVYPGDSGAPVFVPGRGSRPRLAGMIIQRIGPDARAFSHLAVAVDAAVVRETLDLLAAREARTESGR